MQLGKEMTVIALGFYLMSRKAATASNISEYVFTMKSVQSALTYLQRPPEIFLSQPQGFSYTF